MPDSEQSSANGIQAQVLIKLGEIGTDVAVIKSQLTILPDHEQRIRENTAALLTLQTAQNTSRDMLSRILAVLAVVASLAAVASVWLHR